MNKILKDCFTTNLLYKLRGEYAPSLRTRILFFYILTSSLILVAISLVIGRLSADRLTAAALSGTSKDSLLICEKLDAYFNYIESDALYMVYARQFPRQTNTLEGTPYSNFVHINTIYNSLLDIVHANSYFQSVAYYEDEQVFLSDEPTKSPGVSPEHVAIVDEFRDSKEISRWLDVHRRPYDTLIKTSRSPYFISLLHKLFDTRGYFLGVIELNFSVDSLLSIYESSNTQNASFFIVNQDGMICSSPHAEQIGTTVNPAGYGGLLSQPAPDGAATTRDSESLYVLREYPRMGWRIVGTISQQAITSDSRMLVRAIFMIGLGGILLSIFVFAHISKRITDPIDKITSTVSLVAAGDYTRRIAVKGVNEIAVLATQINEMTASIAALMEDIQIENQQKREFELSYIQSQMNPHFLYNTLEMLCGMIEVGDREEVIAVIGDISRFYRGVLTHGELMITLGQELSIAEYYLKIMRRRYPDAFTYTLSVAEETFACKVPKLTLQPIVENAVIHGCVPMHRCGNIAILSSVRDGFIHIVVADDGVGITQEKSLALSSGDLAEAGFGFANTEKRLKLHHGKDARLEIHAQDGGGTKVELIFPVSRE